MTCSDADLRELYSYPESPWLRMNFVASIDGAVTSGGASGALSSETDKHLFGLLRELADVIVVGAGTIRTENYGGAVITREAQRRRAAAGQSSHPPIAVVTARADLDPDSRLFAETTAAPLIVTTANAPTAAKATLRAAGGDVIEAEPGSSDGVDGDSLMAALQRRGLRRILCEGGPRLFGHLLAANLVDDLCLSIAPVLTAGTAGRIAVSDAAGSANAAQQRKMRLAHTLSGDDGTVFTRWVRDPAVG
ncbi:pyrimidine reductase family protein [Hoyosella sp. YIM 151337]|uniref:pyrimidine reductase family protein n=1 Tax=Hoyosella sp. YIM 151337 TaxID=2992742 RepID=UPI002235B408|nr:pyrimidine reductase family protein [Hoyosella sp. YIM 151337]MCW4353277.1 pyrimidine reductase family protein [Hoyosella sp. YIM 151337]